MAVAIKFGSDRLSEQANSKAARIFTLFPPARANSRLANNLTIEAIAA
jgi:hypothetical protein